MEFDLLFCRLWQFLIGTLAFILNKKDETVSESASISDKSHKNIFCGAALVLIFLCTMPEISTSINYKFSVRLLATILGGIIVYAGHYTQLQLPMLVDVCLKYLGDISYGLYLIHWPVILFGRYIQRDSTVSGFIFIIVFCIIASVLLYERFDKIVPTKSARTVFVLNMIMFGIILMFCVNTPFPKWNHREQKIEKSHDFGHHLSIKEIIKINEDIGKTCHVLPVNDCHDDFTISKIYPKVIFSKEWSRHCVVDFRKNGTKTIALLGNSFASRFSISAIKELKKFSNIKKLYVISRAACTIFDTLNAVGEPQWRCNELIGKTAAFLEEIRPDVVIHVSM